MKRLCLLCDVNIVKPSISEIDIKSFSAFSDHKEPPKTSIGFDEALISSINCARFLVDGAEETWSIKPVAFLSVFSVNIFSGNAITTGPGLPDIAV